MVQRRFMAMNKIKKTNNVTIQGIIGFFLGACLAVTGVGLISANRAVGVLEAYYDLTSTAFNATDTPTPTPIFTPTSTPRPKPRDYYESLEEADLFLFTSPQMVIDKVEDAMKGINNPLDLAVGNRVIAEAYLALGDDEHVTDYYETNIELLEPLVESQVSIKDLSSIYYNLIYAFLQIGDYESAENHYDQMIAVLEPMVRQSTHPAEIGEVYFNLIQTTSFFGDYYSMGLYYLDMKDQLDPLLDKRLTIEEIAETYTNLKNSAMLCGNVEEGLAYTQEMVDKLKVLRDEVSLDEDIILVNRYLGDGELTLSNIQFAAVYYRAVVAHIPTPMNIFRLATTYNFAGNHACAYHWYQELLAIEDMDLSFYRDILEESIALIEEIYEGQEIPECKD
jgi:tetratricopeptide (TPR) repeat protein